MIKTRSQIAGSSAGLLTRRDLLQRVAWCTRTNSLPYFVFGASRRFHLERARHLIEVSNEGLHLRVPGFAVSGSQN